MIDLLLWLFVTIIIATIACLLGKHYGVEYLIAMFVGSIVIANAVASKLIIVGPFTASATIVVYSMTFLLTDSISEFWGKKEAKKAVWSGFLALIMFVFVTQITVGLTSPEWWTNQEAFETIFSSSWRIALASFIAYSIAQNHDVWAYHFWKKKTKGKSLWIRNNLSTWGSQTIDTVVFVMIAFYGVFPVVDLIIAGIVLKIAIAAIDTPFLYLIRWYYSKKKPYWTRRQVSLDIPF